MTDTDAGTGPVERGVRPAVAEALRLAEKMMRDSWATGNDAAWQPARAALEAHLDAMAPATDQEIAAAWRAWPKTAITSAANAIKFVRSLRA